jgi:hypothetical protein
LKLAGNYASSQTGDTLLGYGFIPVGRKYHAPDNSHLFAHRQGQPKYPTGAAHSQLMGCFYFIGWGLLRKYEICRQLLPKLPVPLGK